MQLGHFQARSELWQHAYGLKITRERARERAMLQERLSKLHWGLTLQPAFSRLSKSRNTPAQARACERIRPRFSAITQQNPPFYP